MKDKVILITGGSKGLGFVIAKQLIKEQCKLALCARSLKELQIAQKELEKLGGKAFIHVCDVADKDQVDILVHDIIQHFGRARS
ncbi:MAG TPA: SDR family NAD(P)-dependent oxidoreductase [Bacteriovoracaceae bacterium]|nr:SDR family NAD(P)-dependent oxidoreductase [Bacteriovoracaceae bacterium]